MSCAGLLSRLLAIKFSNEAANGFIDIAGAVPKFPGVR
jgi:hypothetical protein